MSTTVYSQRQLIGFIERTIDNLKKVGQSNITIAKVQSRMDALEQHWRKFLEGDARLHETTPEERKKGDSYFSPETVVQVQEAYLEAKDHLQEYLSSFRSAKIGESNPAQHPRKMPEISLPIFSGKYQEWRAFRDLFQSMVIGNNQLTPVEKLHYLKTHVRGEAIRTLAKFAITDAEFEPAWSALVKRYENKRALVASYLDRLNSLKPTAAPNIAILRQLSELLEEGQDGLTHLKVTPAEMWRHHLVHFISHRLDPETRKDWEFTLGDSTDPASTQTLAKFIDGRIRAFENLESPEFPPKPKTPTPRPAPPAASTRKITFPARVNTSTLPAFKCAHCSGAHYIASCPGFKTTPLNQRREFITAKGLCWNCLGGHRIQECRSSKRCLMCNEQHHTLLHQEAINSPHKGLHPPAVPSSTAAVPSSTKMQPAHSLSVSKVCESPRQTVLLPTARVLVNSESGPPFEARALLDQGSELSFACESLAQTLRLPRKNANIPIVGIGSKRAGSTRGVITLTIRSHQNPDVQCTVSAYILPQLTGQLPGARVNRASWHHLKGLPLADPDFSEPGRIDLVLGADIYGSLLRDSVRRSSTSAPVAQLTTLGWIVSGPVHEFQKTTKHHSVSSSFTSVPDTNLLAILTSFWHQEEVCPSNPLPLTKEEKECQAFFASTHYRTTSGRYVVRLPFKSPPHSLGSSFSTALRMLRRTQQRLSSDSSFRQLYSEFLNEYESLGHMTQAPPNPSPDQPHFFLPHHGILREKSTTTKLRVVFNGSMVTSSGVSLNDCLHIGPKLQQDLSDIIMRWRRYAYVFIADIAKMYRQILVEEQDRNFQRILWSLDGPPKEYQLCTVTYGLASAPYLALRVLHQLATDEGHKYPAAADILRSEMYIDDVLSGSDNISMAQQKAQQLIALLMAGGFSLQKWFANDPDILEGISQPKHADQKEKELHDGVLTRALGLSWHSHYDTFLFEFRNSKPSSAITKRVVLSRIAQIFDPLGWITPITITAKIFMQLLWKTKCDWDEPLPLSLGKQWEAYERSLSDITEISIPRWIGLSPTNIAVELYGFSDASQDAMGAAVYIRVVNDFDTVRVTLVTAKSKVAPIAKQTIPRLELSAAVLLSKLINRVISILQLNTVPVHLWVDSTVALAWIHGTPSQWKEYVANRVATIQELVPFARWHHVSGTDNPADCASRGLSPRLLANHTAWWQGPSWLCCHSTSWRDETPPLPPGADLERRTNKAVAAVAIQEPNIWDFGHRYSSLRRLLRITAWVRKAAALFRKIAVINTELTPSDLAASETFWVKHVQHSYFSQEIKILSSGSSLPVKHPFLRLAPFIDSQGLLRVGGRLQNALLDPDTKHPILLPRHSFLSTLIIAEAHSKTLHGGVQLTLSHLRQKYWILGGRTPVSTYIRRCVRCTRYRATTANQLMGQLPPSRVHPARPFLNSGVDYAGPFIIRTWRGRAAKTYKGFLVIFVCFTTSAVHLELATDYSSQGFLAAYRRFTSRRGRCATLTSDCGSNLVGADAELRRLAQAASAESSSLASLLASEGTEWHFNPPATPHFGGKWEAAVKSIKYHLRRVIGDAVLTYEELTTLLSQIEAVLNSRPLCALSDDPADIQALTPAHFLIGGPLTALPEPSLDEVPVSRLSRWQLLQQFFQRIWRRWSSEYLQRFLTMTKWHQPSRSISVGSLVLISDERTPPAKWPLARVIKTHPGADGLVRVVTVKTATSMYKRPIAKLCILPIDSVKATS